MSINTQPSKLYREEWPITPLLNLSHQLNASDTPRDTLKPSKSNTKQSKRLQQGKCSNWGCKGNSWMSQCSTHKTQPSINHGKTKGFRESLIKFKSRRQSHPQSKLKSSNKRWTIMSHQLVLSSQVRVMSTPTLKHTWRHRPNRFTTRCRRCQPTLSSKSKPVTPSYNPQCWPTPNRVSKRPKCPVIKKLWHTIWSTF